MGLSVVSATLVVAFALALASSQLAREIFAGTAEIDRARHEQRLRLDLRSDSAVDITACCTWTILLQTATVQVKNDGNTVLNASKVTTNLVIDGRLVPTADVLSATIGGATVNHWRPTETLVIVVRNVASNPLFVKVVADNGASDLWRPA